MYDKVVTLFNYYESKQSDTYLWYPTVLRNVDLAVDKAAILAKYGAESQDNASLHVRYQNATDGKMVGEKLWRPPTEWENQVNETLPETLTFKSGDFFWWGEWPDKEPINDDDYMDGFDDYMSKRHDYVFRITSVGGPYSVIPHFEIMGR